MGEYRSVHEGKGQMVPGAVDAVNDDGTYSIVDDGGDREASVAPDLVRVRVRDAASSAAAGDRTTATGA